MEHILKQRTKNIGVQTIKLMSILPNTSTIYILSRQIIRSSTSIGANYRAACRAKSRADFINKLKIVEEESDETLYWLEILEESNLMDSSNLMPLKKELNEIISITVASLKTLKTQ